MKKAIANLLLLSATFVAGYWFASWRWFASPDAWEAKEPVLIRAADTQECALPRGTRLHYQSSAHGDVDFYVLMRLKKEEAMVHLTQVEDGISRVTGAFR